MRQFSSVSDINLSGLFFSLKFLTFVSIVRLVKVVIIDHLKT